MDNATRPRSRRRTLLRAKLKIGPKPRAVHPGGVRSFMRLPHKTMHADAVPLSRLHREVCMDRSLLAWIRLLSRFRHLPELLQQQRNWCLCPFFDSFVHATQYVGDGDFDQDCNGDDQRGQGSGGQP